MTTKSQASKNKNNVFGARKFDKVDDASAKILSRQQSIVLKKKQQPQLNGKENAKGKCLLEVPRCFFVFPVTWNSSSMIVLL